MDDVEKGTINNKDNEREWQKMGNKKMREDKRQMWRRVSLTIIIYVRKKGTKE